MKNYTLSTIFILGLLAFPRIGLADESGTSPYLEMSSHYEAIRLVLLADSKDGIAEHAEAIRDQATELLAGPSAGRAGVAEDRVADLETALREIHSAASNLSGACGLASAREDFFALTVPMAKYRHLTGDETTVVVYCSMVQKSWIQAKGDLGNPYLGREMPTCGELVEES